MNNTEVQPSREDARDPDNLWANFQPSEEGFQGEEAKAEEPKSYHMEVAGGFSDDGVTIDAEKWKQWFYDKDTGANKDETYFNKMLAAIEAWNNTPLEERKQILETGNYTDSANGDLFGLLTSSRMIVFGEPAGEGKQEPVETGAVEVEPATPAEQVESVGAAEAVDQAGPAGQVEVAGQAEGGDGAKPEIELSTPYGGIKFWEKILAKIRSRKQEKAPAVDIPDFVEQSMETEKDEDKYKVLLVTEVTDVPPEEKERLEEEAGKARKKLLGLKRLAIGAAMALLMLNPFVGTKTENPESVSGVRHDDVLETVTPGHMETIEVPGKTITRQEEVTTKEVVPVQNLELGATVELEPGTELHYTSDTRAKEYEGHGKYITKEDTKYTLSGVAVYDADGRLLGNYHSINGAEGSVSDFMQKARDKHGLSADTPLKLFYHYAREDRPDRPLGWTDAETAKVETTKMQDVTETGPATQKEVYVEPEYEARSVEIPFSGNVTEKGANTAEIVDENGNKTSIEIRSASGELLKPGSTVIGEDGFAYTINSIETSTESGTRVDALRVAHDLAVVGTGILAMYLLGRKKKKEGEAEGEGGGEVDAETNESEDENIDIRPVYVDLTGAQLQNVVREFSALAGDQADALAAQFASATGEDPQKLAEATRDPAEGSLYASLTPAERIVARTLLTHLHEPSSIDRLTRMLGTNYNDFMDKIGIDVDKVRAEKEAS